MKERACRFGPEQRLAGILSEPSGTPRLGCVLVSAGLVPKFGPYRLYAELARRLAAEGIATLRFDLGSIGDSAATYAGLGLAERTALEIDAALDWLAARLGATGLVLGGLCSGAEDALRSAASDPRVTGVFAIDPFAYRTASWALRHALHRVARRSLRAVGVYEPSRRPASAPAAARPAAVSYKYMEHEESSRVLGTLLARGTRVHFVYTAGARESFNHATQLKAAFPELDFGELVTLDYMPRIDHTQLLAEDRAALVETVARRLAAWAPPVDIGVPSVPAAVG